MRLSTTLLSRCFNCILHALAPQEPNHPLSTHPSCSAGAQRLAPMRTHTTHPDRHRTTFHYLYILASLLRCGTNLPHTPQPHFSPHRKHIILARARGHGTAGRLDVFLPSHAGAVCVDEEKLHAEETSMRFCGAHWRDAMCVCVFSRLGVARAELDRVSEWKIGQVMSRTGRGAQDTETAHK